MNSKTNIIALITDFGTKDYFVGSMKGVILSINNQAKIIDITHEIPPQDINAVRWTLKNCYKNFPAKTIFVAVVDPGVGSSRSAILVETEDYYFIAPDNGLLSFVLNEEKTVNAFELTNDKFFNHPVSNTFHERDIFSPVAAHLSNGVAPSDFGNEITNFISNKSPIPIQIDENTIEAEIIHIDHFGNLITNLKKQHLPKKFTAEIKGKIISIFQEYYSESENNELTMVIGSAEMLEIVVNQQSAAKILNAKVGDKVIINS